jgi:hypothetical protein
MVRVLEVKGGRPSDGRLVARVIAESSTALAALKKASGEQ